MSGVGIWRVLDQACQPAEGLGPAQFVVGRIDPGRQVQMQDVALGAVGVVPELDRHALREMR